MWKQVSVFVLNLIEPRIVSLNKKLNIHYKLGIHLKPVSDDFSRVMCMWYVCACARENELCAIHKAIQLP